MLPQLSHADPRPSETAALAKITPYLTGMKRAIYDSVAAAGEDGLLPDELPFLINTCRRRFTDLWKEGLIKPTLRKRNNARGNPCTVWVAGRDEAAATKHETKKEVIARLRAEIDRLREVRFVFLPQAVHGDFLYMNTVARAGLYEAHRNPQGAVSVKASNGHLLGVKPDEFVDVGPLLD